MPQNEIKEYVYLGGKVKWFKPDNPSKYDDWNHALYLDDPSLDLFKKLQAPSMGVSGIQNKLMKDEDGFYTYIRRPCQLKAKNGRVYPFEPPVVVDKDGNPWPFGLGVGNGSEVVDKCEYRTFEFNGRKGTSIRWEKTKIVDHIPFEPEKVQERIITDDTKMVDTLASRTAPKDPF